jgi:phage tail protein, P2 protein I family
LEHIDVPLRQLWSPETCPEEFLPWLAWGLVVDQWDDSWPVEFKRAMVANTAQMHKIRGTKRSVNDVIRMVLALAEARVDQKALTSLEGLERYNSSFNVREWWETINNAEQGQQFSTDPLTFDVQLLIGGGVLGGRGILGGELYRQLRQAIDAVKPLSTRYKLSIGGAKLDAELPALKTGLRVKHYHRFQVAPQVSLKLKTTVPLGVRARSNRYGRFTVSPKAVLKFTTVMPMGVRSRAVERRRFSMKAIPTLNFKQKLTLQASVRNLRTKKFHFKPE